MHEMKYAKLYRNLYCIYFQIINTQAQKYWVKHHKHLYATIILGHLSRFW